MERIGVEVGGTPRGLAGLVPSLLHATWLPPHRCLEGEFQLKFFGFALSLHPSSDLPYRLSTDGAEREVAFPFLNVWVPGRVYRSECAATFETLYFGYGMDALGRFAAACPGGALPDGPLPLRHAWGLESKLRDFLDLMENVHCQGGADRLDAAAFGLVSEALLCRFLPPAGDSAERGAILNIAARLGERDLSQLLKGTGLSRRSFFRKWRLYFREPPRAYALSKRLERATSLLAEGMPVKDVAEALGFSSAFHLSREFKRRHGVPPSQWRRPMA